MHLDAKRMQFSDSFHFFLRGHSLSCAVFPFSDGMWRNAGPESHTCIDKVKVNPRAEIEKEIIVPGANVDVLLEYNDLDRGLMHPGRRDCSHYCMPGVPDVVAARLLESFY